MFEVAEVPFLPEADITSIICSWSHCTMALSGGVDLSQSSNMAMMFLATWVGVSFPLLQDRRSWNFVTRPPLTYPFMGLSPMQQDGSCHSFKQESGKNLCVVMI